MATEETAAGAGGYEEEEVPVPESEPLDEVADLSAMAEQLKLKIPDLERELGKPTAEDPDKLKPMDVKDIEKPERQDYSVPKFPAWFDRFRDLLANRHASWVKVLEDLFFSKMAKIRMCSGPADKAGWHHRGDEGCHPEGQESQQESLAESQKRRSSHPGGRRRSAAWSRRSRT